MKFKTTLSLLLILVLSFSMTTFAQEKGPKEQTLCPVMGNPINKESYVDYQGQRIYFCCGGCDKTFLENPDKYFKEFAKNNIVLENVQTTCPTCGHDLSKKETHVDHMGRRVYLCSDGCAVEFKKDPKKYLEKLNTKPKKEMKKSEEM